MILYIDLVFFVCGIMDFLILMLCCGLLRIKTTIWKIVSGAGAGALISILLLVSKAGALAFIPATVLIIRFVFGKCSASELFRRSVIFFGVLLVSDAAMNAFAGASRLAFIKQGRVYNIISLPAFIVGMTISGALIGIFFFFIKNKKVMYKIEISVGDEVIYTTALLDTGNRLRDPVSLKPVIIMENSLLGDRKPESVQIDFRTVGSEQSSMRAIPVKRVRLIEENRIFEDLYAGISEYRLSRNGEFHVLLHSEFNR